MPSSNLELVRSIYQDWERGEFGSAQWADPKIEMLSISFQHPGSATGFEQIERFWSDRETALTDFRVRAEDVRELDQERVLALAEWSARGKASGIAITHEGAHVFEIREGRVVKVVFYEERARAFDELGLAEDR